MSDNGVQQIAGENRYVKNYTEIQSVLKAIFEPAHPISYITPNQFPADTSDTKATTFVSQRIYSNEPKVETFDRFDYIPQMVAAESPKAVNPNKVLLDPVADTEVFEKIPLTELQQIFRPAVIKKLDPTVEFLKSL